MIIILLLIRFMYILKIQRKQNINILLTNVKTLVLIYGAIQRFSLNIQIICKMSIEILKGTTQADSVMY